MQLFAPDDPRPVHFMGIGGAGMSALALIARRRGVNVTGCDTHPSGAVALAHAGVGIAAGHDPTHVSGARAIVYTSAIPAGHEELEAARAAGVRVVRRAEALQEVVSGGTVVAVAGSHGKTTTTAMVTEALVAAGVDPTGIAGGRVATWGGNVRFGSDALFVVEADEFDRSFLALEPTIALVNNVEADHLECYGTLAALEGAFAEFAGRSRRLLVCADDGGALRVSRAADVPTWLVGMAAGADIRITAVRRDVDRSVGTVTLPDGRVVGLELTVPGLHNVRNAAMALGAVLALDGDVTRAAAGLAGFRGVERRFQLLGTARGVMVVDDYAHHPTEVAATIAAARQRYPGARTVAVFQPHLYSRTQAMGEQLGRALAAADVAVVTEVYGAREQPIPGVSGLGVADVVRRLGIRVEWVPERARVVDRLAGIVAEGDVVLTLGAGDVTTVGPELLARLRGAAA